MVARAAAASLAARAKIIAAKAAILSVSVESLAAGAVILAVALIAEVLTATIADRTGGVGSSECVDRRAVMTSTAAVASILVAASIAAAIAVRELIQVVASIWL